MDLVSSLRLRLHANHLALIGYFSSASWAQHFGTASMKSRHSTLQAKRFEVTEKARKVASLEMMVIDLEHTAMELAWQISIEEKRTGVKNPTTSRSRNCRRSR